jgi:hypothetical protein
VRARLVSQLCCSLDSAPLARVTSRTALRAALG